MSAATAPPPPVGLRAARGAPLFVQVFALVLLTLIGAHAVNLAIVYFLPPPPPEVFRVSEVAAALSAPGRPMPVHGGQQAVAPLLAALAPVPAVPVDQRPTRTGGLLREELADHLGRSVADVRLYFIDAHRNPVRRSMRSFQRQLAPVPSDRHGDNFVMAPFVAAAHTADGRWSVLRREETAPLTSWAQRMTLWFAASALAVTPLAWLFARRFAAPFAEFAEAAGRLGRDPGAPPLERIRGPREVQTAAAAFNDMQGRLNRYVHDRTAMVGAIAHDLRTPLTRLRFRVESAPPALAAKMTSDIEQMEQMISDTMAFVRDATHQGERCRLELSSLVQTVADEMADTGLDVSADGRSPVVVYGDALALRRLVSNLLDNAVKFGACARARVYAEAGAAVVEVDDDGPGVPAHERERVFEPFHRGEPSRSRATGGAGLGLAVVRTIARAHGGEAELENRPEGGLRARFRLPLHLQAA